MIVIEVIDADAARLALHAGILACPSCHTGRLGPWGTARRRVVRGSASTLLRCTRTAGAAATA
jgi:hypothetical protein